MEKEQSILLVDDDEDILEFLSYNLKREGYTVHKAGNGPDAIKIALETHPDLIILDVMMPGMDGIETCSLLRRNENLKGTCIAFLTARGEDYSQLAGFDAGADDYIVKPFSLPVLIARVRRALSRLRRDALVLEPAQTVETQGIQIDERRHEVSVDGARVDLTSSEFSLLNFLANHPGWVYTRSQIVKAVHGENYPVTDRSVDVMVLSLRRKLGPRGKAVETVRGVGYRFAE